LTRIFKYMHPTEEGYARWAPSLSFSAIGRFSPPFLLLDLRSLRWRGTVHFCSGKTQVSPWRETCLRGFTGSVPVRGVSDERIAPVLLLVLLLPTPPQGRITCLLSSDPYLANDVVCRCVPPTHKYGRRHSEILFFSFSESIVVRNPSTSGVLSPSTSLILVEFSRTKSAHSASPPDCRPFLSHFLR